ncbi:MAG: hypothetical protein ACM3O3_03295 [Syntrophothermus sp.]
MKFKYFISIFIFINVFPLELCFSQNNIDLMHSIINKYLDNRNQASINIKNDSFNINIGKIFSSKKEHAYVKYINKKGIDIGIFEIENNKTSNLPIKYIEVNNLEFINDTLVDINNDHLKELLIHTYPNSGCCLRDKKTIYFYNTIKESFDDSLIFFNPQFLHNGIIISLNYGHSGETSLYKGIIKENVFELQQVIEPINNEIKKYYLKSYINNKEISKEEILKLPEVYLELPQHYLNWFDGNLN